ncbi:hypothetical protein [Paenibacillus sp. Marseille-Q4541]|uniref:hypothetical protein n=1 Tax=Paenibacillus sp. Marseille-Q4541 TaxID=2831522 RepID=UPI001BAB8DF7|nr:hypothetical protein [Paenibacillus sp. Marseille-Q4541]
MKKGTGYLIFNAIFIIPSIILVIINGISVGPVMLTVFSLCITGFLVLSSKETKEKEDAIQKLESQISMVKDFTPTNILHAANCVVALDENKEKLVIANTVGTYTYDFKKVIESEIFQDEVSISKVSRTGQIGGALVGGVLAGGVGAIIGGLSSSKQNETQVRSISLKIVLDDLKRPYQNIQILNSDIPLKLSNTTYTQALEDASQWQSIMSVIISRNQRSIVNQ